MSAEPIQEDLRANMNALAHALDEMLNGEGWASDGRKLGFLLAVFGFGDPDPGKRFNYISNADSLDVAKMLKDIGERQDERFAAADKLTMGERYDLAVTSLRAIVSDPTPSPAAHRLQVRAKATLVAMGEDVR